MAKKGSIFCVGCGAGLEVAIDVAGRTCMERIGGNLDIMFATGKRSLGMDFDFASFVFCHTVAAEQQNTSSQRCSRTHLRSGAARHTVTAEQPDTPSQRCSRTHRRSGAAGHTFAAVQQDTPSQRCSRTHRHSGAARHTVAAVQQDTSRAHCIAKSTESRKNRTKFEIISIF